MKKSMDFSIFLFLFKMKVRVYQSCVRPMFDKSELGVALKEQW